MECKSKSNKNPFVFKKIKQERKTILDFGVIGGAEEEQTIMLEEKG